MNLPVFLPGMLLSIVLLVAACRSSSTPQAAPPDSPPGPATSTSVPEPEAASANIIKATRPQESGAQSGSRSSVAPAEEENAEPDLLSSSLFEIDWDDRSVLKPV